MLNSLFSFIKYIFKSLVNVFSHSYQGKEKSSSQLVIIIFLFLVFGFIWAYVSKLDQVVTSEGRVISDSRLQVVEHFEGGRILKIHTKSGAEVKAGDLLVSLSPLQTQSELNIVKEQLAKTTLKIARLESEYSAKEMVVPKDIIQSFPSLYASEINLFQDRKRQFSAQLSQQNTEIISAKSRISSSSVGLSAAEEEFRAVEQLVNKGLEARLSLVRAEKSLSEARTALIVAKEDLSKAEFARVNLTQQYRSEILKDLTEARSEFSKAKENIPISADRADRTQVRSPIDGIVNRVLVTTEGESVNSGKPIVEIVPLDAVVLVETKISPADIGFIRQNQKAMLKFTSYDFSIFGSMEGHVSIIGSDSIQEQSGNSFYLVKIDLPMSYISYGSERLNIIPGMVAQVDIITGKRSVIDYIFSPITKVLKTSMREK